MGTMWPRRTVVSNNIAVKCVEMNFKFRGRHIWSKGVFGWRESENDFGRTLSKYQKSHKTNKFMHPKV